MVVEHLLVGITFTTKLLYDKRLDMYDKTCESYHETHIVDFAMLGILEHSGWMLCRSLSVR